jgi:hypothetical protein
LNAKSHNSVNLNAKVAIRRFEYEKSQFIQFECDGRGDKKKWAYNYGQWKLNKDGGEQGKAIDDITQTAHTGNQTWKYNLELSNEQNAMALFRLFRHAMEEEVGNPPADDYKLKYKLVGGDWKTL